LAWRLSPLKEFVGITDHQVLRIAGAAGGIPVAATEILSEKIDGGGRFNRRSLKGKHRRCLSFLKQPWKDPTKMLRLNSSSRS
jgi:hypothetical protein